MQGRSGKLWAQWGLVLGLPLLALLGALAFTTLVLLAVGSPPYPPYWLLFAGVLSSPVRLADMLMLAAPLLLCSSGLTLTFAAGLYNLGIEGQVIIGAVFAMVPLRWWPELSPVALWLLTFGMGALGGMSWALLTAWLRVYGRVNEIFAGLGLNFVATGVTLYLVLGPWKREGSASTSGTEPLDQAIRLPTIEGLRLAPLAPLLALVLLVLVWWLLRQTRWGLSLRATGLNAVAAERFAVPSRRRMIEAMAGCGVLAGLAGTIQVLAVFHTLTPSISSGIGLLALLVTLLVQAHPLLILPVVLFFALLSVGSTQLPLQLQIDSSIGGVLQGALVLCMLLLRGLQQRWSQARVWDNE
ncbi:MAG: ABC transporter permease [Chloroflexaceae bacterium]|nr:ABC transporter permease [Chloroflexaceae bacterium]